MTTAGKRLLQAADEALAIAEGWEPAPRIHIPPDVEVKPIRQKLGLSQDDFATEFGFSINQIRDWEQKRSRPTHGLRAYLMIIDTNPGLVRQILAAGSLRTAEDAKNAKVA